MSDANRRVFDHVVIIMFENEYRSYVMDNSYMRSLAAQGIDMANFSGVMHPSHPNYLASISGEICNVTADPDYYSLLPDAPPAQGIEPLPQRTVPDLMKQSGLSWHGYMESYFRVTWPPQLEPVLGHDQKVAAVPTVRSTLLDYPPYMNVHNPFVRFQRILEDPSQWKRIGTVYEFLRDVVHGKLPEYSWITPDLWGDGHFLRGSWEEVGERAPVLVDQLARWLRTFFDILRFPGPHSILPPRTLVVVTFDESDFESGDSSSYNGPNQIYTVLLGDMIEPGGVEEEGYNHYSLLKTVEQNFELGDLGKNDADSNWFQFLWGRRFEWGSVQSTPVVASGGVLAAAGFAGALYLVYGEEGSNLSFRTFDSGTWSGPQPVPVPTTVSAVELVASGGELVLVCRTDDGLSALTYTLDSGWSAATEILHDAVGSFAVSAFVDYGGDRRLEKLMLAYQKTANCSIWSMTRENGAWGDSVDVGQSTQGDMAVATLGPSLYLIYTATGSDEMSVVSYNTAQFNVVTADPKDSSEKDTTRLCWAPIEYPVAHYWHGRGRKDDDDPRLLPYHGGAPLVAATLDGVIHLAHPDTGNPQVLTETFSMAGLLTAKTPDTNAYGTLAEAGWSRQMAIRGAFNRSGGGMSISCVGASVVLLFQREGGQVQACVGRYVQATV